MTEHAQDAREALAIHARWESQLMGSVAPAPPASDLSWWSVEPDAREFARAAHAGQTRKGTDEPYFLHLAEVAMMMGRFRALGLLSDEEYRVGLRSAWLHDAVEDCGVPLSEIERLFGAATAECVSAMTKKPKDVCLDPMSDSLERIRLAGKIACLGKAADRISNLSWTPPPAWNTKKVRRYGQEGRLIAATLSGILPTEACLALELVADAYVKAYVSSGPGAAGPRPAR